MDVEGGETTLFEEAQRFRQPRLWVVVVGVAALVWRGTVQQILLGTPFGSNPAPRAPARTIPKRCERRLMTHRRGIGFLPPAPARAFPPRRSGPAGARTGAIVAV
ncbi:MAG: hypothetical protein QCH35_05120 [Methanomicrobiaceae archaeon]|nr:hypothetical protein [Methanomicrobiaceae archaeon]